MTKSNEKPEQKPLHTFKIEKTIQLTAFIDDNTEIREDAFTNASITLEKLLTSTLLKSEIPLNFLITDKEQDIEATIEQ